MPTHNSQRINTFKILQTVNEDEQVNVFSKVINDSIDAVPFVSKFIRRPLAPWTNYIKRAITNSVH